MLEIFFYVLFLKRWCNNFFFKSEFFKGFWFCNGNEIEKSKEIECDIVFWNRYCSYLVSCKWMFFNLIIKFEFLRLVFVDGDFVGVCGI